MEAFEIRAFTLTLDDWSEKIVDLSDQFDLDRLVVSNKTLYWRDGDVLHSIYDVYDIENESHRTDAWLLEEMRLCGVIEPNGGER